MNNNKGGKGEGEDGRDNSAFSLPVWRESMVAEGLLPFDLFSLFFPLPLSSPTLEICKQFIDGPKVDRSIGATDNGRTDRGCRQNRRRDDPCDRSDI